MFLTTELISKIDSVEFAYTQGRMNVVRDLRQDPSCVDYFVKENLFALMAPQVPNAMFNRAIVSGPVALDDLKRSLELYRKHEITPDFELSPGAVSKEMAVELAGVGLLHTKFLPVLVKPISELSPARVDGIETREVASGEDLAHFKNIYVDGWQVSPGFAPVMRSFIDNWVEVPGWRLFMALKEGTPIATAVLYQHGDFAYLADATTAPHARGLGAQTALIAARVDEARRAKAKFVFSRADFGSISQRNMEKAGLRVSYVRAAWTKV